MTHKNCPYTAPEAELLVIRFEENFLESGTSDPGSLGNPGFPGSDILDPGSGFDFIF